MFLMQKKNQKKNTEGGFTLIEILVVIGIIAILATIVLIAINPARQFSQANDTQRTSNVNALLNGIGQYIADNKGAVPAGIDDTVKFISTAEADLCAALVPTYLPALPVDPTVTTGAVAPCPTSPATYDTKYSVTKDATTGRITVSATLAENGTVSVTR